MVIFLDRQNPVLHTLLPLLAPVAGVPWSDTDLVLVPILQIVNKWWLFMHMHVLWGVS